MLRFQPDGWVEGLLRPFVLADPYGYVYFEAPAPDLRFAAITILLLVVITTQRARLSAPARHTLAAFVMAFYLWTFISGNGRYFIAGLLLAGPLLVLLVSALPASRPMRVFILGVVVLLQAMVVHQNYRPGIWALARSTEGPALTIDDSPVRHQPGIFLTLTSISYSLLVPMFHPDSRWANIGGQVEIRPGIPEYLPLRELLSMPLPRYVVVPIRTGRLRDDMQPANASGEWLGEMLSRHGLERASQPCEILRTRLMQRNIFIVGEPDAPVTFWVCALREGLPKARTLPVVSQKLVDVFAIVEQNCPRFFPPGGVRMDVDGDLVVRTYHLTDTQLLSDGDDNVYFRHQRALNPTLIGNARDIRRGDFSIPCDKLPGRYVYPWRRE